MGNRSCTFHLGLTWIIKRQVLPRVLSIPGVQLLQNLKNNDYDFLPTNALTGWVWNGSVYPKMESLPQLQLLRKIIPSSLRSSCGDQHPAAHGVFPEAFVLFFQSSHACSSVSIETAAHCGQSCHKLMWTTKVKNPIWLCLKPKATTLVRSAES